MEISPNAHKGVLQSRLSAGRKSTYALKITPLIDLIFLLLIFFLVVGKWRPPEDFLPLQLPKAYAAGQKALKPEPLTIRISSTKSGCVVTVDHNKKIKIKKSKVESDLATLMKELETCLKDQSRYASDPVELICTPELKWDYLGKIYNSLYGSGMTDITFRMTEPPANVSSQ